MTQSNGLVLSKSTVCEKKYVKMKKKNKKKTQLCKNYTVKTFNIYSIMTALQFQHNREYTEAGLLTVCFSLGKRNTTKTE